MVEDCSGSSRLSLVPNADAANPYIIQLAGLHREAWTINMHYWLDTWYICAKGSAL